MTVKNAFIGRPAELARIAALLEAAEHGTAGGLLVVGEAGVGKSRLLAEGSEIARGRGMRVAGAACLPMTTALPLDPVHQLLRSLGQRRNAGAPESARDMFRIVLDQLERATVAGPLLLCLDDMQWSDSATIDLVHYCLARLIDVPLAWLLAARTGSAQSPFLHRLEREGHVERLALPTLSNTETRLLAEAILGSAEVDTTLMSALRDRTGGNAFLCVELLRAIAHREDGSGEEHPGQRVAVGRVVPASVRGAIEERADRMPGPARAALDWAAILPEPFTFEELEAVGGKSVGSAPEQLADAGFLMGDGEGRWTFAHSIVRDALYRRLPEAERVRRHAAVAEVLAAGPVERLAPQLERAHRWHDAADAYLRLAGSALVTGEGEDAARLYDRSRTLAAHDGDERLERSAEAGHVFALIRSGASSQGQSAAASLRAKLRAGASPAERLTFLARYAMLLMLMHDASDMEAARDALREAGPLLGVVEGAARADGLAARAWMLLRNGEPTEALSDAEAAGLIARDIDDDGLKARVLNPLGLILGMTRSAAQGADVLEVAARHALAAGLPWEAGRAYMSLSFLDLLQRDSVGSMKHIRLGLQIDAVPPSVTALLRANLGFDLGVEGDLAGALAHELTAIRIAERAGPLTRARAACALGYVHLWRGELAACRRAMENDELLVPGSVADARASEVWGMLFEEEGSLGDALSAYRAGTVLDDPIAVYCETGVARTAAALGDVPSARAALTHIDRLVKRWPVGDAMREEARGWLALVEARGDDAVVHFRAAAAGAARAYDGARLHAQAASLAGDRAGVKAAIDVLDRMGATHAGRPRPRRRTSSRHATGAQPRERRPAQCARAGGRATRRRRPDQRRDRRRALPQPTDRGATRRQHPV